MKKSTKKSLVISSLALAVQGLLFASLATTAQASTSSKKPIGDLEIYQAASGGKVTITMMLDTSGSMSAMYRSGTTTVNRNNALDACDFPASANISPHRDDFVAHTTTVEQSKTTPQYDRVFCVVESTTQPTYVLMEHVGRWYDCLDATCQTYRPRSSAPGNRIDLGRRYSSKSEQRTVDGVNGSATFYFDKNFVPQRTQITRPDRITRLKDALFELMDGGGIDYNATAIGLGQYSTSSDNRNQGLSGGADGISGKILVPADILTPQQRLKIKTAVAGLRANMATPSATAYAEVAGYMLGENMGAPIRLYKEHYFRFSDWYYRCTSPSSKLQCDSYNSNEAVERPPSILSSYTEVPICASVSTAQACYTGHTNAPFVGYRNSVAESKNATGYISPLPQNPASCDGQGIYFLTDGEPNTSIRQNTEQVMRLALGTKGAALNLSGRTNTLTNQGKFPSHDWPLIGHFSKALRVADSNPKNVSIRTAVVGFGSVFDVSKFEDAKAGKLGRQTLKKVKVNKLTGMPLTDAEVKDPEDKFEKDKTAVYFDCRLIPDSSPDAKNACNWGAKSHPDLPGVGGFGEGGFYSATESKDVVESVKEFLGAMTNKIDSAPSGTINIPDDPYSVAGQQAVAYMPVIKPLVAEQNMVWPGNMKKYHVANGTIWGKNNQRLYKNAKGDINPDAQDGWSTSAGDNGNVEVGGFYASLKSPVNNVANVRQVFIEDFSGAGATDADKKPKTRKLGVNAGGQITLDGTAVSAGHTFRDTATYTTANVKYLLHFLGFSHATVGGASVTIDGIPDTTNLWDITLQAPSDNIRVLGASPHSAPSALSYGATLDSDGVVASTGRDDYVLFGSMDGALHLVNAQDKSTSASEGGNEVFAFIPKVMLQKQIQALKQASTHTAVGEPVFGVDAPWAVFADYRFGKDAPATGSAGSDTPTKMELDTNNGKGLYAYGGFRLGGEGIYGLKLNDRNSPEIVFAYTPNSSGFERLGQIWAKPTKAKIKVGNASKDVIIFGGGYDLCYENENFQVGAKETFAITNDQRGVACAGKTEAIGNAVYMVDAHTGARLWTATHAEMKHSVVAGVTTLDRDADGNLDAIYFADLGGQVFRADFNNSKASTSTTSTVSSERVVRLLSPAGSGKTVRRFYEKPVVSIYRGDEKFNSNQLFALVNVISGDRSNPTSKMRASSNDADRVYGIFDTDIGKVDLYKLKDNELFARDIADSNLKNLSGISGQAAKEPAINDVKSGKGWYYPIIDFDGYTNIKYGKGVGKLEVISSLLFTSVYNPDKVYSAAESCSASVKGGTERQMYCLPYGVCRNATSTNGRGGYSPAGQGISELTLGPLNNTSAGRRKRTLISNVGLDSNDRIDFNRGSISNVPDAQGGLDTGTSSSSTGIKRGDGSHPSIIVGERFTLQPVRWYDNTVKN